ncbi:hypothetical protein RCZ04_08860 [Capnocytophaga sp. HP1101]
MKHTILLFLITLNSFAQVTLKSEYFAKGKLSRQRLSVQLPIALQKYDDDPYQRMKVWAISTDACFVKAREHSPATPYETMNLSAHLVHLRPLHTRWSLLMAMGIGAYTPANRLSAIVWKENVLGSGALLAIWHGSERLQIGAGVAVSTLLGYPMAFPSAFAEYKSDTWNAWAKGNFLEGGSASVGYRFNEYFTLNALADFSIYASFLRRNEQKTVFFTQHSIIALQPEFSIGKNLRFPFTIGIDLARTGTYKERQFNSFFTDNLGKNTEAKHSFYFSMSVVFSR